MSGDGSKVEINPAEYKKDLPTPSTRHQCKICGRPANYRTTFDPVTLQAEWLCPECHNGLSNGNGQTAPGPKAMFTSNSPEWYTPREIVTSVIEVLREIDLDPCSNSREDPNIPARTHYTKDDDGLSREWSGRVYMNPPYGREIAAWIEKLQAGYEAGSITEAITLVKAATDTKWFNVLSGRYARCEVNGRLKFSDSKSPAPFPSVIFYLGEDAKRFSEVFSKHGTITAPLVPETPAAPGTTDPGIIFNPIPESNDQPWSLYPVEDLNTKPIQEIYKIGNELIDKFNVKPGKGMEFWTEYQWREYAINNCMSEEIRQKYEKKKREQELKALYSVDGSKFFLNHSAIAEYIIAQLHVISFNADNTRIGQLFVYKDGRYVPNKGEVQQEIKRLLDEIEYSGSITEATGQVLHHIAYTNPIRDYPFNTTEGIIPVRNCCLQIDYEAGAVTPIPHSPEYLFSFVIPVDYDPEADPSPIDAAIRQWVSLEDVDVKYQIPAQALLHAQGIYHKKAYINDGERDAGKSTYLKLLLRFFGPENVADVSMQAICEDQFALADLEGKLINIHDELKDVPLKHMDRFKDLTGREYHRINRKHQQPYTTMIGAVHVFSCNEPPKLHKKDDDAFFSRFEYTTYPNQFKRDPRYLPQLLTEGNLSGFLKTVLSYLIRMVQINDLVVDSDPEDIKEKWINATEPVQEFYNLNFNPDTTGKISTDEVYQAYKDLYCSENKITAMEKNRFSRLFNMIEGVSISQARRGGKAPRVYKGIKWANAPRHKPINEQREFTE
ncbi:DNA N-6-adenine-methyltransferase [anaerobic digester metagenome]